MPTDPTIVMVSHPFEEKVYHSVLREDLLAEATTVVLAVSGGVDSVSLLECFSVLFRSWGLERLVAVYVDHGLRPEATEKEAALVHRLAQERGIAFRCVPIGVQRRNGSLQDGARQERLVALERVADEEGAQRVALGHHADDQAETLLLRLLRGTGPSGLAGMAPRRGCFVRPLLSRTRAEIEAYARARHLSWLEDESNQQRIYRRNDIRLRLLPLLEEYNPQIRQHLASLASLVRDEVELLEDLVTERYRAPLVRALGEGVLFELGPWDSVPRPLQLRCLRRAVCSVCGHDLELRHLWRLWSMSQGAASEEKRAPLGADCWAIRSYQRLWLLAASWIEKKEPYSVTIEHPGVYPCSGGILEVEPLEDAYSAKEEDVTPPSKATPAQEEEASWAATRRGPLEVFLPAKGASFPWTLRSRQPGDRLAPGATPQSGSSLKKFFVEEKIPRFLRGRLPLVALDETIGWIPGVTVRSPFATKPPATDAAWRLRLALDPLLLLGVEPFAR